MSDEKLPRPRQVTMAGWMIVFGSVLAVLAVWDHIAQLRSLEMRERVAESVSRPPFSSLGVDVDQVLDIMHVLALVTGACAAAAAVLGWQVMHRHRAARLVLSVLAVPLVLGGMGSGGLFTTLVAVSVVLLWLQPSRDWFDGVEPRRPAEPIEGNRPGPQSHAAWPPAPPAAPVSSDRPSGTPGPGAPVPPPPPAPAPMTGFGSPQAAGTYGPGPTAAPDRRPATITAAAVLTWVFSALTALLMAAAAVVVLTDPQAVLDEALRQQPQLADQGMTTGLLTASTVVMAVLAIAWAVAAGVMAALALRPRRWARTTWVVLVAVAAVFLLIGSLASVLVAVPMIGAVVTLSLLLRPEARAWYARARR